MYNRQHNAFALHFFIGQAKSTDHLCSRNFKIFKIAAIVYISHLVCFSIPASENMCIRAEWFFIGKFHSPYDFALLALSAVFHAPMAEYFSILWSASLSALIFFSFFRLF